VLSKNLGESSSASPKPPVASAWPEFIIIIDEVDKRVTYFQKRSAT
jgi:hypothetical protein